MKFIFVFSFGNTIFFFRHHFSSYKHKRNESKKFHLNDFCLLFHLFWSSIHTKWHFLTTLFTFLLVKADNTDETCGSFRKEEKEKITSKLFLLFFFFFCCISIFRAVYINIRKKKFNKKEANVIQLYFICIFTFFFLFFTQMSSEKNMKNKLLKN